MTTSNVQRKLTAILHADVVGYSRMMGQDEPATISTLTAYRQVFSDHISKHRGRIVNAPGDALLAEFASVVDAVECAVEIQRELAESNETLPEERRMQFRIGVNLGDVIVQNEDIYGDGVNIAARLESLAEPGGICISGSVHDNIRNKLPLQFHSLGEKSVKNIAEPVRVYRVLAEGEAPGAPEARRRGWRALSRNTWLAFAAIGVLVVASLLTWLFGPPVSIEDSTSTPAGTSIPLPEKPSIAVLPFKNLSGNPEQEYFGEGLSEDIITRLAKIPSLFTISRNSSFSYKGRAVNVKKMGEELGVRYVLEGSVQKAGDRFRVTAQLIDAVSGNHKWAESYDRELKEFFAVQDEITTTVVLEVTRELEIKLTSRELVQLKEFNTKNFEVWEHYAKATEFFRKYQKWGMFPAAWEFQNALKLDPEFEPAILGLGWIKLFDGIWEPLGTQAERESYLDQAVDLSNQALALNETLGEPHALLGQVALWKRDHARAVNEGRRAVALNPNNSLWHAYLANSLSFAGQPKEAFDEMKKALRLDPFPPDFVLNDYARILYELGHYSEAQPLLKGIFERQDDPSLGGRGLLQLGSTASLMSIAVASAAGLPEAQALADAYKFQSPTYMLAWYFPYKLSRDAEKLLADLAKVGLR